jgi:PPOX class probable F420-dependent enzyme
VRMTDDDTWRRLSAADHGILCTSNRQRRIDAVPVCFAVVARVVATPVDRVKPKETTELARLRNLEHDARATLLCEHWDREDWSRLWWVRAHLVRRPDHDVGARQRDECEHALREKYPQYRRTEFADVVLLDVTTVVGWSAGAIRATGAGSAADADAGAGAGAGGDPG